jgi:L-fucose isomerase-like protein
MKKNKSTFAVFIGNRGFFSSSMLEESLNELLNSLKALGHTTIMPDYNLTANGAIETPSEGKMFAEFLRDNYGRYDGVILSLPNFGDETGAVAALQDCGVPIFIHAFPDELNKMNLNQRRDAFCGKFAMMNLFTQYKILFSVMSPHAVHPDAEEFKNNIDIFDRVCRICKGMKKINIGAFGARTTPFKAVRYDEVTLQRHGISVETFDLSDILIKLKSIKKTDRKFITKANSLKKYCGWEHVPEKSFENMIKLGMLIDDYIEEYELDALALRCWSEIQQELDISPCVLLSELNERGIAAACELDICSAVAMHALKLASDSPCACFDWNNNYGTATDKCIIFHCGPAPKSIMRGKGVISGHGILQKSLPGCGTYGCLTGRLASSPVTCGGMITLDGNLSFYFVEGNITEDPVPEDFFGCAGVIQIPELQDKLTNIGRHGFRHHVALTHGHVCKAVEETFNTYLKYTIIK